jgi:hypothetical protein
MYALSPRSLRPTVRNCVGLHVVQNRDHWDESAWNADRGGNFNSAGGGLTGTTDSHWGPGVVSLGELEIHQSIETNHGRVAGDEKEQSWDICTSSGLHGADDVSEQVHSASKETSGSPDKRALRPAGHRAVRAMGASAAHEVWIHATVAQIFEQKVN